MLKIVLADISFVSVERTTSMPNPLRMSKRQEAEKGSHSGPVCLCGAQRPV